MGWQVSWECTINRKLGNFHIMVQLILLATFLFGYFLHMNQITLQFFVLRLASMTTIGTPES